jgi:hypothetical protein
MDFPMNPTDGQIAYRQGRQLAYKSGRCKPPAGYQMWQTVSDRPYSPVFATAEELARWCSLNPWGAERDNPVSYETWLRFINGPGWAPSMIATNGNMQTGVHALATGATQ